MESEGAGAVFVLPDLMLASQADRVGKVALLHRLPTMAWGQWFTKAGCLMAYSAEYPNMIRSLAGFVDKILKGANPGDLPIERATKFVTVVNLKTAKALGLDVSPTLLAAADEVVE